jgi:hypothetical protein
MDTVARFDIKWQPEISADSAPTQSAATNDLEDDDDVQVVVLIPDVVLACQNDSAVSILILQTKQHLPKK